MINGFSNKKQGVYPLPIRKRLIVNFLEDSLRKLKINLRSLCSKLSKLLELLLPLLRFVQILSMRQRIGGL